MSRTPIPILVDTDIGNNADDALALAYLLRRPECELVGITTVTGEPIERARLASALCRAMDRDDIPIAAGSDTPLVVPQQQAHVPQRAILDRWPHRRDFSPDAAGSLMTKAIRRRPGEVTLLTLGPLTNVARLYAADPSLVPMIKQHVLMGGLFFSPPPGYGPIERNVGGDPHAAKAVFEAGVPLRCVSLDVTTRCAMTLDEARRRFASVPPGILSEMLEVFFAARDRLILHDPLAAAVVFEPSLCRFKPGRVSMECRRCDRLGATQVEWSPPSNTGDANDRRSHHKIAVEVEPLRFLDHYFATLG